MRFVPLLCALTAMFTFACSDENSDVAEGDASNGTSGETGGDGDGTTSASNGETSASNGTTGGTTGGDTGTTSTGLTFWEDVAPILDNSCMGCHQEGGIAPFTFATYEDVKTWGPAIVASTHARTMPPWLVVSDGSCEEYEDSEWLSDADLATLKGWVDDGMIEGPPGERNIPEPPTIDANVLLTTPEFDPVRVGSEDAEFDEYRCFPIELDLEETKYLTGYEVFPGNTSIVHHVIASIVDPSAESRREGVTNAERMAELDAESPDRLGWPCFAQAGPGVAIASDPVAWAPGQGAVSFPEGTGVPVAPGSVLVVQMHYNLFDEANIGSSDSSVVGLRLEDQVDTILYPLYIDFLLAFGDTLEPGEAALDYRRSFSLSQIGLPVNIKLWGIMPHMHELGVKLNATIKSEGEEDRCVTQVDNWDFDWQRVYWYKNPPIVRPTDTWELTCTYDTTGADGPVSAGWGTKNEMCLTVVYGSIAL